MAIGCKRPLGPNPGSPRRSAGPLLALALGMALGASTLRGQWLETKITLPDSLGGATGPCCLATDSSERFVYVGDYGGAV